MSPEFPSNICFYIKVTPEPSFEYQVLEKEWTKTHLPDFYWYDLDNFSEGVVVDYALQMLQQAQNILLIIKAEPNSPLGGILKIIPQLHRSKSQIKVIFQGDHAQLQKMLKPLNQLLINPLEAEMQSFVMF